MSGAVALVPAITFALAAAVAARGARWRVVDAMRSRLLLSDGGPGAVRRAAWVQPGWRDPGQHGRLAALMAIVAGTGLVPLVGLLASVLAAAMLAAWAVAVHAHRLGAGGRYDRTLLEVVEELARQLRSGASIQAALRELPRHAQGPVGADLDELVRSLDDDASTVPEALRRWSDARARPSVRMVSAALCVGHQSGGLRARMVDDVATTLRQFHDARHEGAALATQAQASAAVMVVSPLAFGALLAATDPAARSFLFHAPLGALCVGVGLALDLLAAAGMARTIIGTQDRMP